ncbi:MAG TPA: ATP-binding protein [Gemmatimonadaceae bacterium]|nr:ATP-binding protein [Gemmatimonadaceae bacterium]
MIPDLPADLVPRAASEALDALLGIFPVVVVTGARQTGKSTLVAIHPGLAEVPRWTLDDAGTRAEAQANPASFVRRAPRMIIDEVQRVPELLLAIKAEVDREGQRAKGRFVLTGSANLLMMHRVSESLAGRAGYLRLGPLTRREQLGFGETGRWAVLLSRPPAEWPELLRDDPAPPEDWRDVARRGGLPVPALRLDDAARARWFDAYVTTYLERDLRDLAAVEMLGDFQRTMRALALRIGNPINQTEIARDLGIPQRNISRWLELLETSWLVTQLPAYTVNRTTRLMKRPKAYWNDAALALHLSGGADPDGAHLENVIVADLLAWGALQAPRPEILYWRTVDNAEVDFVIERGRRLMAIEVKASERPHPRDWRYLERFVEEYPDTCHGALLLHAGDEAYEVADRIVVAPWWRVV